MSIPLSSTMPSPLLHLDTSHPSPDTTRVAVTGEVDLYTAAILLDGLLQVLREQTAVVLEADLAGVTFLDCAGADALVVARHAAGNLGVQLRITHPQRIVRRVLDLVELLTEQAEQR